jgi:predicted Rossmann fold flavoprotein
MMGPVEPEQADVAIIGGGAAGLAAAIFTARRTPTRRVRVLDGARQLGAKILVSGGGRCNVTNTEVTSGDFHGGSPHAIRRILGAFPARATVSFFKEIGVSLHEEPGGKLFPDSQRARTVLEALIKEARDRGVALQTGSRVETLQRGPDGFTLGTPGGALTAAKVILATGGLSLPKSGSDGGGYRLAQSLGHTLVPTTPALVPLLLEGDFHQTLSGISQDVRIAVRIDREEPVRVQGALLWTHFGASGPAVLDASRTWLRAGVEGRKATVQVSMLPEDSLDSAHERFLSLASQRPRISLRHALSGVLPSKVAHAVLDRLTIDGDVVLAHLSREDRGVLLRAILEWPLPVSGSRGYQYAEVTAGGVPLEEVNPGTMESRKCPGVHLIGEILDVDGRIGGFNFQWAWSSGYVAGNAV